MLLNRELCATPYVCGVTKCLTKDEAEGEAKWKAKKSKMGRNDVAKRGGATKNGRTGKV